MNYKQNERYERFTIVDADMIRDKRLSNADLGFLVRAKSFGPDWDFSVSGYTSLYPKDGRFAVTNTVNYLKQLKYISVVSKGRRENGQFKSKSITVFEKSNTVPVLDLDKR